MKRLYKSNDKQVCGVCAGIAEYLDVDVTLVRLLCAVLIIFGGLSLWAYIIAAIIIPDAPADNNAEYVNEEDNMENLQ